VLDGVVILVKMNYSVSRLMCCCMVVNVMSVVGNSFRLVCIGVIILMYMNYSVSSVL